jgi:hypothetical protein
VIGCAASSIKGFPSFSFNRREAWRTRRASRVSWGVTGRSAAGRGCRPSCLILRGVLGRPVAIKLPTLGQRGVSQPPLGVRETLASSLAAGSPRQDSTFSTTSTGSLAASSSRNWTTRSCRLRLSVITSPGAQFGTVLSSDDGCTGEPSTVSSLNRTLPSDPPIRLGPDGLGGAYRPESVAWNDPVAVYRLFDRERRQFLGYFETREEAEARLARLVANDPTRQGSIVIERTGWPNLLLRLRTRLRR